MYRKVSRDGTVSGGPMHYLRDGLAELGWPRLGMVLAIVFAVLCIGASFGGGCVFQVSQSLNLLQEHVGGLQQGQYPWLYGLVGAILTGVVIIGGIRRIAATAEKIVPLMCGIYLAAAFYVLLANYDKILPAFGLIFSSAFTPEAGYGGFLGVMVIGIKRAGFSNEAGVGSAPIAHAAAQTNEPISEGIVAMLGPLIDTVVICTVTGLVMVVSDVYCNEDYSHLVTTNKGAALTSVAFAESIRWFPYVLCCAVVLFAFSTMISWSYYGERCWSHLFGQRSSIVFKLLFITFVFIGSVVTPTNLLDFSDVMLYSMALPNIFGVICLSGKVRRSLDEYWGRYKAGELEWKRRKQDSSKADS
jgi:AGCS family alanine or glycine:cation symporter